MISRNGGFIVIPEQRFNEPRPVSPSDIGLTIEIVTQRFNQPILNINIDSQAGNGLYRIPLIINYEFPDRHIEEIYRFELELQVLDRKAAQDEDRAAENAADLLGGKDLFRAKKLGFLNIKEGPPVTFDPCKANIGLSEWCVLKDPSQIYMIKIIPKNEVVFGSSTRSSRRININTVKLKIRQNQQNPREIFFEAGPELTPGIYMFSFDVMMGNKKIDEFLVAVAVRK